MGSVITNETVLYVFLAHDLFLISCHTMILLLYIVSSGSEVNLVITKELCSAFTEYREAMFTRWEERGMAYCLFPLSVIRH